MSNSSFRNAGVVIFVTTGFSIATLLVAAQQSIGAPEARQVSPAPNPPNVASSVSYDALIDRAINLIQTGDFTQAAQTARDAIALNPARYEAYLYLGISRFRQDAVVDAESALQKALSLTPEDRKPKVQDALDLVVKTRRFRELMATADEADRDGASAKAARTYAEAWWLFPERVDIAAKALKGLTATSNDFEAARIWNTLTPAQKSENASLFKGISINTREVSNENDRRRPSLQEAINASQYDRALELVKPMAQADVTAYAPVVGALLFLNKDRTALRSSSALKPEQLVRMDLFTEAQMNQMVHSALFRNYLEDVVGGNPDRTIETLRTLIEKLAIERRARAEFQQAFASAKGLSDTAVRLKTLQELRKRYPDHAEEITPELDSTARLAERQAAEAEYERKRQEDQKQAEIRKYTFPVAHVHARMTFSSNPGCFGHLRIDPNGASYESHYHGSVYFRKNDVTYIDFPSGWLRLHTSNGNWTFALIDEADVQKGKFTGSYSPSTLAGVIVQRWGFVAIKNGKWLAPSSP